jgi:hypothetical protein
MIYKLYKTLDGKDAVIGTNENGSMVSFIFDPDNTDYQQYLKWLEEGNTPEPAEETI